jgi:hypothetical protein
MHNCIDNIKVLEQMRKNIEIMQTKAESKLKDIIESSKGFFGYKILCCPKLPWQ